MGRTEWQRRAIAAVPTYPRAPKPLRAGDMEALAAIECGARASGDEVVLQLCATVREAWAAMAMMACRGA